MIIIYQTIKFLCHWWEYIYMTDVYQTGLNMMLWYWTLVCRIFNLTPFDLWLRRKRERGKERSTVKFAYYYFLSFSVSFVRKWTLFLSPCACGHTYVYSVELREHRSNSIVLYIYIFVISYLVLICYSISLSLRWPLSERGNDLIVTSVGVYSTLFYFIREIGS